MKKSMD